MRSAQSAFDHQKTTHRGLGDRHDRAGAARCDALFPADLQGRAYVGSVGSSVRPNLLTLVPFDTQTTNYGRCFGIGRLFEQYGIGAAATVPFATIQHRRKGVLKRSAERHPGHLSNSSVRYDPIRSDLGGRKIGNPSQAGQR